ncbi:hypothetical protein HOLleu_42202 [Holothuria leucospilota]|uniref:PHD-type domain-containing protein n=1 Tax=Holothuria leucospilota TaxID=206669 RepID=A0A9Q0YFN7_HOLLE|nr:hypothetical protein HOLleu_42202 [Holothuria leucospilota]
MSQKQACKVYNIPRATLYDKLKGKSDISCPLGSPTISTKAEEQLATWAINMNNSDRQTRTGEALGKERALLTSEKLDRSSSPDGNDLLCDPTRLFNADESWFPLAGKCERVLAEKGSKNVYNLSTSDKSQITVLAVCSADGFYVPPMLIFPAIRFKYDSLLGRSSNGWIDREIFYEWIANHFYTTLLKEKVTFPVVLLVDGHASHVIQPLDVSVFKSLKSRWSREVRNYQITHPGENVTKQSFASVFAKAWKSSALAENARSGFRKCGIFPLDPGAIDKTRLLPSEVEYMAQKEKSKQEAEAAKEKKKADKAARDAAKQAAARRQPPKKNKIDPNVCAYCGEQYDEEPQNWIGCDCGRWVHKKCTNVQDLDTFTDEEISQLEWLCSICEEE